jgi:alginate O-acetyltransferase complex protein AlgJ
LATNSPESKAGNHLPSEANPTIEPSADQNFVTWSRRQARSLANTIRRQYHALFVAILIILLLLPLQGYPGNFNDFSKLFWGYDSLVRLYTAARFYVIKDQIFGDVIARPGPWLVYTGEYSIDYFQNTRPFTGPELERIQQNLDGLNDSFRAEGIRFLVIIVPGKNAIYPEYMPRQIPVIGSESTTDQVLAYEKQHGQVTILDLRPALLAARQQHQVFYATDTHWNQYGILAGYMEIMRTLQKDFPNLKPHTPDDFKPVSQGLASGDIGKAWTQGLAKEEMIQMEPFFKRQSIQITLSQGTASIPGRMVATYNPDLTLPRAVIYHDSFFNSMIPFLSDHFQWAVYHWWFEIDKRLISGEKPDIVIFEVTDRYLYRLMTLPK